MIPGTTVALHFIARRMHCDTSSRSLMHFTHKEHREVVGDRRIPASSSRDQNLDFFVHLSSLDNLHQSRQDKYHNIFDHSTGSDTRCHYVYSRFTWRQVSSEASQAKMSSMLSASAETSEECICVTRNCERSEMCLFKIVCALCHRSRNSDVTRHRPQSTGPTGYIRG